MPRPPARVRRALLAELEDDALRRSLADMDPGDVVDVIVATAQGEVEAVTAVECAEA